MTLDPSALASIIGDGATVEITGRIGGSSTATISALMIRARGGATIGAIAKAYDRPHVRGDTAIWSVDHEARGLTIAEAACVPAPRVVAADRDGSVCGVPVLVMTRLGGRPVLASDDPRWTAELAATLCSIVDADVDLRGLDPVPSWVDLALERPAWFTDAGLWAAAWDRFRSGLAAMPEVLLHRDFHPINVVWRDGEVGGGIEGVVDWVHTGRGPAGYDIGRCRVNVALTMGMEMADRFLADCGELGTSYDFAWDLETTLALCGHIDVLLTGNELGAGVTADGVRATVIEMTRRALG